MASAVSTAERRRPKSAVAHSWPGNRYWSAKWELVEAPRAMTTSRTFTSSPMPPAEPMRMMVSTPKNWYSS